MAKIRLTVLFLVLSVTWLFAQTKTTNAPKVPNTGITVDGNLTEYYWTTPSVGTTEYIDIEHNCLTDGVVDNDADCSGKFKTFWDDNGFYVGTWFYDDIHNSPHSQYLDDANNAYEDDGLEEFYDADFSDAWNATGSRLGTYGIQYIAGFGNLDPTQQYRGFWGNQTIAGQNNTGVFDIPTQQSNGWYEVFTSADGTNYTDECCIKWTSPAMHATGSKSVGGSIGFNWKLDDNDGAFTHQAYMAWTGIDGPATSWGQVMLQGAAGIHPVAISPVAKSAATPQWACDVFGRQVAMKGAQANRIVFTSAANSKSVRNIVLR
jgi:hypothetical protein